MGSPSGEEISSKARIVSHGERKQKRMQEREGTSVLSVSAFLVRAWKHWKWRHMLYISEASSGKLWELCAPLERIKISFLKGIECRQVGKALWSEGALGIEWSNMSCLACRLLGFPGLDAAYLCIGFLCLDQRYLGICLGAYHLYIFMIRRFIKAGEELDDSTKPPRCSVCSIGAWCTPSACLPVRCQQPLAGCWAHVAIKRRW